MDNKQRDFDRGWNGAFLPGPGGKWGDLAEGAAARRRYEQARAGPPDQSMPVLVGSLLLGLVLILSLPFLYPIPALLAGLLGFAVRQLTLTQVPGAWSWLASLAVAVPCYWAGCRWDHQIAARFELYRRFRHGARLLLFALGIKYAWPWAVRATDYELMTFVGGHYLLGMYGSMLLGVVALNFLLSVHGLQTRWHSLLQGIRLRPAFLKP